MQTARRLVKGPDTAETRKKHFAHVYRSDYPLAPIKKSIPYGMLSPIAKMICDKHKLKRMTNVEKL